MMQNNFFKIEFKPETGTVKSLVMNHDPDGMNWVEGLFSWGLPADFEFVEMKSAGNEVHSRYRKETLELEVIRILEPDRLTERYIYRNTGYYDLYFQRTATLKAISASENVVTRISGVAVNTPIFMHGRWDHFRLSLR